MVMRLGRAVATALSYEEGRDTMDGATGDDSAKLRKFPFRPPGTVPVRLFRCTADAMTRLASSVE